MRIAQIAYRCCPVLGGAEVYIGQLRVVLGGLTSSQTCYQAADGEPRSDLVQVQPRCLTPWKLANFNLGLRAHRRELRTYDLLIVHNPEHLPKVDGVPTVLVSHGATWTHEASLWRRGLRRAAMRRAFERATAVVANDSFVLRKMGYDVAPGKQFHREVAPGIWFIPNAVDTTIFHPGDSRDPLRPSGLPAEWPATAPVVVVPRNLSFSRGIDLALRAFAASTALPHDSILLVTGRSIPDMPASIAYERDLRRLAVELGLGDRVRFLGGVPRADMPGVYRSASLTLIPTRCSEGTSLAAIESMATGTATITSAVEGLLDLPGPHCPPEPRALARAIDAVWPERRRWSQEQRRAVLPHFNLDVWGDCWRTVVRATARARIEAMGHR